MTNKLEFQAGPSDDREMREHADPIMAILARLHDDPAIADMVALRQSRPDLRDAAVKAEAHRNAYGWSASQDGVGALERIALLTIAGAHAMIVAIFPVSSLDDVDAKVAMQPSRDWLVSWQGSGDYARGRIAQAAFNPGQLAVPREPDIHEPDIHERESALYPWPVSGFDLAAEIESLPNRSIYTSQQLPVLASFAAEGIDMGAVLGKARDYFAAADRLFAEALRPSPAMHRTRLAAEGALIAAHLSCAQIAVWPARRGTGDRDAKLAVQELVNGRAKTADPLHLQAAIRHGFTFTGTVSRGAPQLFVEVKLGEWVGNV
ncbi:MAG: hypothetical protein GY873_13755 [Bosea sp.]|uniref:hypothetical protein n=1 Tax=Bosea sp. (in: a-proteobacteria) TaxID=1871050 RepID=UPI0023A1E6FB|nr:hypothetical protein [Bosea sp. (in: a-proteobacteria)]MCP4735245.1 hypothetical protein [Bosea sp. (in: a-proteobacteria)]